MLNRRLLLLTGILGACMLAVPPSAGAQRVVYYTYATTSADMPSCRGFTSIHRAVWYHDDKRKDNLNVSYPVVAELDPRSPAGIAGFADGDSIVTINRYSTIGARDPELSLWNLDVGDFNRVQVKRGNQTLELSFHMGGWVVPPLDGTAASPTAGEQPARVCRNPK
jgi:hypothetical protein